MLPVCALLVLLSLVAIMPPAAARPAASELAHGDGSARAPAGAGWQKLREQAERYEQGGQLDQALSLWKQAVAAAQLLGERDPRYLLSLHALARLESDLGQYAQAQQLYEKLISAKEKYYRGEDLGLPWNLTELGDTLYRQGRYKQAAADYERAAQIFQVSGRLLGKVPSLRKLAFTQYKLGEAKAARNTYYQALATAVVIQSNPETLYLKPIVLEQVGQMNADRSKIADRAGAHRMAYRCASEAESVWGKLKAQTRALKVTPPPRGRLGQIIRAVRRPPGPPPTYLSEAGPQVVDLLEKLAGYYCDAGKYAEAELLLARTVEVYDDVSETNRNFQKGRKDFIAEVYKSWHACRQATPAWLIADQSTPGCTSRGAPLKNPYLTEFAAIRTREEYFERRPYLVQAYAWAVPTCQAVTTIKEYQPIVEAGAGTGYWASLLKQIGADVVAYDITPAPSKKNPWHFRASHSWTEVLAGDESIVTKYPGRALFISWPPHDEPFAVKALSRYRGKTFIYAGEGPGGCNGDRAFFQVLARDWKLVNVVPLPQWAESHDSLKVYQRK